MKAKHIQYLWMAAFLLPALVVFALIYAVPIATIIGASFTRWNGITELQFIGLANYARLLHDETFHKAFVNSLLWGAIAAFVHVPFGVLIALILNRRPIGWRFVRAVTMLPNIIPPAALALLYVFIFNPGIGLLNQLVRVLGYPDFTQYWLVDPRTAFLSVTLVWVFYAGVIVLIVMAELAAVPQDQKDAARCDGATNLQIDLYINLPALRYIIGVGIIIAVTEVFKMFESIFLTTGGGPENKTINLGLLIYQYANNRYQYGYADTIGVVLLVLGLAMIFTISKIFGERDA